MESITTWAETISRSSSPRNWIDALRQEAHLSGSHLHPLATGLNVVVGGDVGFETVPRFQRNTAYSAGGTVQVRKKFGLGGVGPISWLGGRVTNTGPTSPAIGKWHLGYGATGRTDYTAELKPGPLELGFDYHFGIPQNNGDRTGIFVENHRVAGLRSGKITPTERKTHYGPPYDGLDAPQRDEEGEL
jgi:hypothetical protein